MVPHLKHYLNYSQRNSNSKLGLKLQTLKTGVDGLSVKGSMVYRVKSSDVCNTISGGGDTTRLTYRVHFGIKLKVVSNVISI